jgi:iron complex outermembrane recepter protein
VARANDLTSVGDLDPNTPGIQAPDYGGNTPGYAPKWIIQVGYDHEFDLGDAGTLTARINTAFKSSYFTNFLNYHDAKQKAYHSTDLALDYKSTAGVNVTAFVRNLENKRPLTQSYFLAAATDDILNFQFGTPRTYGVRLAYEF